MFEEVLLVFGQFFPVLRVLAQIDFIDCPETSHLILVHLPNVLVLNWQNHEAIRVLLQQGLRQDSLSVLALTRSENILWRDHL